MEVSGHLRAPAALPPDKVLPVPEGQRLGGLQSRSGRGAEEKIIHSHALNRAPVVQSVA